MGDFLDRLIERTLGLTPMIEPLIPSRYTPQTTDGLRLEDEIASPINLRTLPPETESTISYPSVFSSPLETEKTSKSVLKTEKPSESAKITVNIVEPTAPVKAKTTDSTNIAQSSLPQPSVTSSDSPPATLNFDTPMAHKETTSDAKRARSSWQQQDIPIDPHPPLSSAPPEAQVLVPPQSIKASSVTNNVPQSLLADSSTHLYFQSPDSSVEKSQNRHKEAPTIRVSIGRIEVRAVHPPPPVRSSSPPAPQLSLDDYLRLRQGGQR